MKLHSEEICFLRGEENEKKNLNFNFFNLMKLYKYENKLRFFMGIVDSILIKYGSFNVGISILALPVFGAGKEKYLKKVGNDPSLIMKDYDQNSSLLISLSKAIGKIVISYKKIQILSGTTKRVMDFLHIMDDFKNEHIYKREIVDNNKLIYCEKKQGCLLNKILIHRNNDSIYVENSSIIAPNGELLLKPLTLKIKHDQSILISGPNGSGKTALFRILAGLWPIFDGKVMTPPISSLYFLTQKVYLPKTSLRGLIIYPDWESKISGKELLNKRLLKYS